MTDILQLGNPLLRQPTRKVINFADSTLQDTIDAALSELVRVGGVGIAAPQVGGRDRWCVIASHPTPRYPDAPYMSPLVLINPNIVRRSKARDRSWEGCLSVPGVRGLVSRATTVTVNYQTRDGQVRSLNCEDFVARIVQHECDHLDGVVFLDRVESSSDLMSEAEYRRQVLRIPADLPV
ncbi:MAG: peptide deformylase [Geitlerinemataceae cyanobacterium]